MENKRVRLIRMEDPYTDLKEGDEGVIRGQDGLGNILVKWDNGSNLSLVPDIDEYELIDEIYEKKILKFYQFI